MNRHRIINGVLRDHAGEHQQTTRLGLTLVELLIVFGILVTLVAFLWPANRRSREAAHQTQCRNNLKQIGLALQSYHDKYECYPPAFTVDGNGKPLHSWRTLILPFLDQQSLYEKIDLSKPWDDPANAEACATSVGIFFCPGVERRAGVSHLTTYLGVVGENAFFYPSKTRSKADFQLRPHDELIAVVDVDEQKAVPWMSPLDSTPDDLLAFDHDSISTHSYGLHCLQANGAVMDLRSDMPLEERKKLLVFQEFRLPE